MENKAQAEDTAPLVEFQENDPIVLFGQRVWEFLNTYRKESIAAGCVILALIIGISGFRTWKKASEADAATKLGAILMTYAAADADAEGAIRDLSGVAADHSGTLAGRLARLYEARVLMDKGDAEAAAGAYTEALSALGKDALYNAMIVLERAYAYEAAGKKAEALTDFRTVSGQTVAPYLQESALYNVARLGAESGDLDQSRADYAKLLELYPDSLYKDLARQKQ